MHLVVTSLKKILQDIGAEISTMEPHWCIQSLKIVFQVDEYCARGPSKFKSCIKALTFAYIINILALKGS